MESLKHVVQGLIFWAGRITIVFWSLSLNIQHAEISSPYVYVYCERFIINCIVMMKQ